MNKVIIKLSGGVGNQLFQCAYALYVKKYFGKDVYLNFTKLRKSPHSSLVHTILNIEKIFGGSFTDNLLTRMMSKPLMEKNLIGLQNLFGLKNIRPLLLTGYFQHHKYAETVIEFMKSGLQEEVRNSSARYRNECRNHVIGVHFRGGDYFTNAEHNKKFGVVDMGYFEKAIDLICSMGSIDRNQLVLEVITDDSERAETAFRDIVAKKNYIRSDWVDDFCRIGSYKYFIIPNSTFSWWSRLLLSNDGDITIYPNNWSKTLDEEVFNFKIEKFIMIENSFM